MGNGGIDIAIEGVITTIGNPLESTESMRLTAGALVQGCGHWSTMCYVSGCNDSSAMHGVLDRSHETLAFVGPIKHLFDALSVS